MCCKRCRSSSAAHISDVAGCSSVQGVPEAKAASISRGAVRKQRFPTSSLAVIGGTPHGAVVRVNVSQMRAHELMVEHGVAKCITVTDRLAKSRSRAPIVHSSVRS